MAKKLVKESQINGRFVKGNPGGPGRPKGSKNRFTEIKEIIAETFFDKDVNGKKRYKEKSMTRIGFREMMKDIVALMPKDIKVEGEGLGNQIIIIHHDGKVDASNSRIKQGADTRT